MEKVSEEIKLTKFYRNKLFELRYMQKMMTMDPKFTKEDFIAMDENIKQVKKMYAKALLEEKKQEEKVEEKKGRKK